MLGCQCSDCGQTNTVCLLINFTERCGKGKRKSLVVEEVEMKVVVVVVVNGAAEENDDERRNEREGELIY